VFDSGSLFEAIRASISLPTFYEPVQKDGMILIDGGVVNPIPLNRVKRQNDDILMGVDVSGHDYKSQNVNHFNYYTVLSRTSSLMIRQNSILMTQLTKPDILVDIQMSRYGGFDYDKSEKLIAIGRQKTQQAIAKYEGNVLKE
jgi:NTE family protein